MSDIYTNIGTALYSKLTNCVGTALWGTRVFSLHAPATTALPYVVFYPIFVTKDNMSFDTTYRASYQIDVYSLTQADARVGGGYVEDSLHNVPLGMADWANIFTRTEEAYLAVQTKDSQQVYVGGVGLIMILTEK